MPQSSRNPRDLRLPLLLTIRLPASSAAGTATVTALHVAEGQALTPGMPVLDFDLDLSDGVAYDCPPVASYRIAMREPGWVRRVAVATGHPVTGDDILVELTGSPDDVAGPGPSRPARVTTAGIVQQGSWWDDPA